MSDVEEANLTARQRSELEYHREHARKMQGLLQRAISYEVLESPARRWWNPYWTMFKFLTTVDLSGKKALVVGCGFGEDALRLAKLGADVYAFDLSPEQISIAKQLAVREGLTVHFEPMLAERLTYSDNFFDLVLARDILHHVDIPLAINEIVRVSKKEALFVINEIYSHSWTDVIRGSKLVRSYLYPRMQSHIYGTKDPYLTPEERKLNENDLQQITKPLPRLEVEEYFNLFVTRLVPDKFDFFAKIDRIVTRILRPFGRVLAGRILFAGRISK